MSTGLPGPATSPGTFPGPGFPDGSPGIARGPGVPGSVGQDIVFYYGDGELDKLTTYRCAVLQPDFYRPAELAELAAGGVRLLGYLSVTEDVDPDPAPWHRPSRNPDWGGHFVHVGHPGWVAHVLGQATAALDAGFHGLFLDCLNVEFTYPEDLPHTLALIGALRAAAPDAYLLANRGFELLPQLGELVDGVLFESFSARWTDEGYAPWPPETLEVHAQYAERLLHLDIDLFALDYADTPALTEFARRRAERFGMVCSISDKALSRV
ncbi:hypothetical protein AB0M43_18255 [Longispora sp. NPDC051575]|uniref:hypothetical protein n=1 Tax=Longispora sp. NPDC051575 TaxID=3154943 RepID=UPI0034471320